MSPSGAVCPRIERRPKGRFGSPAWAAGGVCNGLAVVRTVSEVGSALNGHRPKRVRLLCDPKVVMRVVEHRNRLARCGAESIEAALAAHGRRLVVVDSTERKDDLVADMTAVMVSLCGRVYGRRSARNRAEKAIAAGWEGKA